MGDTNVGLNPQKKNDYLELLRFVASLLIMITHLFYIEIPWGSYGFTYSWIYVEFFFMLTGYFTTRHFMKDNDHNIFQKIKISIVYTVKKFWKFVPYSIVIVFCAYFMAWWPYVKSGDADLFLLGKWFVSEVFFLSEFFKYPIYSGTLWYLCAMVSVFPIFCLILQIKNDKIKFILTAVAGAWYYCIYGITGNREFPHDLLRAFSCLCLGTVVYYFADLLGKVKTGKTANVAFTVVEIAAIVMTGIIAGFNLEKFLIVALIMFIVTMTVMFSGKSYTGNIECKFFRWLGKLSVPIFMWQWTWETFIMIFLRKYGFRRRIVIYFAGTLALAIVHSFVVEQGRKLLKKWKQKKQTA